MSQDRLRRGNALPAGRTVPRWILAVVLACALPAILWGQGVPDQKAPAPPSAAKPIAGSLPAARRVLDRHVEAIGGRAAVLSHSSTAARGTLSMPKAGMTGTIEIFSAKPNRSLLKVSLGGVGEVIEGFDGQYGWSQSPMTGPMLLEGRQLDEKKFDSEFYGELRDDSRYLSMTTLEQTDFDGRACYKLRLVRKTGGEDLEFYDVATGLKAGTVTTRETIMGRVTGTTVETDYRKFGKLLVPTTIRSQMAGVDQVITIAAVEYDNVPPSVFEMPAAIKALIK